MTDPHWRARLLEIQDLLLVAHDTDRIAYAVLQLVAVLQDEWSEREHPAVQLVKEAIDLFRQPHALEIRRWLTKAEALVGPEKTVGRAAEEE